MSTPVIQVLPNIITVAGYYMLAVDGNPSEQVGTTLEAQVVYVCPWASRWDFARQLRGGVTYSPDGTVLLTQPARYPYNPLLYCAEIQSMQPYSHDDTPATENGTVLQCKEAQLTAIFKTFQGSSSSAVLYTENFNACAEFITLPNDGLYWDAGKTIPAAAGSSPAYQLRKAEYTYTRNKAPLTLPANVISYINCVNTNAITSRTFGVTFAVGTMLYHGPSLDEDRLADGQAALKVKMTFSIMSQLWNKFPHAGAAGSGILTFDTIYKGDGNPLKPYDSKPLEELFYW
jgi:hypothetical protein